MARHHKQRPSATWFGGRSPRSRVLLGCAVAVSLLLASRFGVSIALRFGVSIALLGLVGVQGHAVHLASQEDPKSGCPHRPDSMGLEDHHYR